MGVAIANSESSRGVDVSGLWWWWWWEACHVRMLNVPSLGLGCQHSVFVKILDYSRNFLVSLKQHSPFMKAKRVSLTPTHSEEGHE